MPSLTGKGDLILMAKKQVAEKELEAKTAELQGADARLAEKETIEKLIQCRSNRSNHH